MKIDLKRVIPEIKNKQRILIAGNKGTKSILSLVSHILKSINKPFDTLQPDQLSLTESPIILIEGFDRLNPLTGQAFFIELDPHIALYHKIEEGIPEEYESFERYIEQYEILADSLPKAGSFIYYNNDNVAMMIGKKEREDVKNIEYDKSGCVKADGGFKFEFGNESTIIHTEKDSFAGEVAAAHALLQRISVTDHQFIHGLKTYSET